MVINPSAIFSVVAALMSMEKDTAGEKSLAAPGRFWKRGMEEI